VKNTIFAFLIIFCFVTQGYAQSCSVVCLNDSWIPESYNVGAKCAIKYESSGIISVHETDEITAKKDYNRADFIPFKVAIYKKKIGTLVLFSEESYIRLDVQKVLAQCQKGDQIMVILDNTEKYSLPHHRIDIL